MVFNSFPFIVFIVPVILLYWTVFKKNSRVQNLLLLGASLFFYAYADWRFLGLLILSVLTNFYLGLRISNCKKEKEKNLFLYLGLIGNIGLLLYFKYFNFFYEGFLKVLSVFGDNHTYNPLEIILPLGISFFTFQVVGYLMDVYNEDIEPSNNLLDFSVFIMFFPKILSGPIERASNLMPQIEKKRVLSYPLFADGLRQILWGLFAKIVIAENCATITNPIFDKYTEQPGSILIIGAFFYSIQIYADFSGYSNMAIGVSKLFGINLMRNFSTPYFSTNISDFWRKWHISLTTWMMDYVYTPLSFTLRKFKKAGLIFSIVATFILVGFWHGANWTFVVFGLLHGLYFIPLVYLGKMNSSQIVAKGKWIPSLIEILKMLGLFVLIMLTDVFFRADTVIMAFNYINHIFSISIFSSPLSILNNAFIISFVLVVFYMVVEWINREREHDFQIIYLNKFWRWTAYYIIFFMILYFGQNADTFIYFQF
jgi:alginate O-acetyltransferase complex protein AlgI